MSSLWTPGGEHDVPRDEPGPPTAAPPAQELTDDQQELMAQLTEAREQLAKTPASVVVANHAIGLFQLAALHLDRESPNLVDARLAIDAFAALVDGLEGRLGEEEDALRDGLSQLRLAFVEVSRRAQ